jgi:hypothetical protein
MQMGGERRAPAALPPGKRPGTQFTGRHQAGLDGFEKILPPSEFDPRTVQSVVSRYAD